MVKKISISILVLTLLLSCKSVWTVRELPSDPFIQLDSSYDYFVREVYRVDSGIVRMLKSDAEAGLDAKNTLIEIEYLFISNDGKANVIYMTTVPDRRQKRYSENYLGNQFVNMHDVRIIHFGKINKADNNQFIFHKYNPTTNDEWTISKYKENEIFIRTIKETKEGEFYNMMLVDSALADPVRFTKIDQFQLVYYNPKSIVKDTAHVEENKIYYEKNSKLPVYLWYDKQLEDGFRVKHYRKKRIPYNPDQVFGF